MKKLLALLLSAAAMLLLPACGEAGTPSGNDPGEVPALYAELEPVELIGADSTGKGAAGQLFGEYVAKRVAQITGGRLTVDYHPNAELGGDADLLRQMQANDIQLVVCQTAPIVSFIPEMAVFDLPMVFSQYDGDTIDSVLNGENDFTAVLGAAYERSGLHLLGFLQNATYRLTTADRDLSTLESFRGLRIRTMENSNHMAFWTAIGAEPTPLAWPEVYIALQNGAIDAEENAADTCVGANFQEVQRYFACTDHILYCNQICMSGKAWDDLAPAYRDALRQAVSEATEYMRPQLEKIDADSKQTLADGGMTAIEYDDSFFESVLGLEGVKALYKEIDENQVNGLGTILKAELAGYDK